MAKYVCPECGGKLLYWKEYAKTIFQPINANTGKPNKQTFTTTEGQSCGDKEGFQCTECGWNVNIIIEPDIPDYLDEIIEKYADEIKV